MGQPGSPHDRCLRCLPPTIERGIRALEAVPTPSVFSRGPSTQPDDTPPMELGNFGPPSRSVRRRSRQCLSGHARARSPHAHAQNGLDVYCRVVSANLVRSLRVGAVPGRRPRLWWRSNLCLRVGLISAPSLARSRVGRCFLLGDAGIWSSPPDPLEEEDRWWASALTITRFSDDDCRRHPPSSDESSFHSSILGVFFGRRERSSSERATASSKL